MHGFPEDVPADAFCGLEWFLRFRVFDELDGVDEADVANFADVFMVSQRFFEFRMEVSAVFVDGFQNVIAFHNLQNGEGDGAGHGISGVGVAVDEGFVGAVVVVESVVDGIGRDGEGHGHVAGGEAFGRAENVGGNAGVLDGKEFPRAAESGGDFVVNEKDAVFVAKGAEAAQVFGGVDAHPGGALEDGLDDHGRGLFSVRAEGGLSAFKAFDVAGIARLAVGAAVAVEAVEMNIFHQKRVENFGVDVHGADGERADGLAVIGFGQAHETSFLRVAGLVLVLKRHFHRGFDGGRSIVVVGEFREAGGEELRELTGELDGRFVGEICENDMLELIDLRFQSGIDFGIGVAQEIAPPRGNNVEIGFPVRAVEVDAFGVVDDDGREDFVVFHLHGRMPDVGGIFFLPIDFFTHDDFLSNIGETICEPFRIATKTCIAVLDFGEDRDAGELFDHFYVVFFHDAARPVVEQDAPDGKPAISDIFAGGHDVVDGAETGGGDDEDGKAQPGNDVFEGIRRGLVAAERADDAAGAFDGHIGIGGGDARPCFQNFLFFQRMAFEPGGEMRGNGRPVQIGQQHVFGLADVRETIHKSRVRFGDGRRAAHGRFVISGVIPGLPQRLYQKRGHIGLADVGVGAGDEDSFAHVFSPFL